MKLNISLLLVYLFFLVYVNCSCLPTTSFVKTIPNDLLKRDGCTYTRVGCIMKTVCTKNIPSKSISTTTTTITTKTIPFSKTIPTTTTTTTKTIPFSKTIPTTTTTTTKTIPFSKTIPTTNDITTTIVISTNIITSTVPVSKTTTKNISYPLTHCPPKGGHMIIKQDCARKGGIYHEGVATGSYNGKPCLTVNGGCDLSNLSTKTKTIPTTTTTTTTKTIPFSKTIPTTTTTTTTTTKTKTIPSTSTIPTTTNIPTTITVVDTDITTTTFSFRTKTVPTSNPSSIGQCYPPKGGHAIIYAECQKKGGVYHETQVTINSSNGLCLTVSATCDLSKPSKTIPTTTKTIPTTTTTTTTKTIPTTTKCIPVTITITEKEKETVTLKETITVTVNGEPTSTSEKEEDKNCASQWAQCGGIDYNGPKCCKSGLTCRKISDYYSQCVENK
jgi:hypothetical protein